MDTKIKTKLNNLDLGTIVLVKALSREVIKNVGYFIFFIHMNSSLGMFLDLCLTR